MDGPLNRKSEGFSLVELLAAILLLSLVVQLACRLFFAGTAGRRRTLCLESFEDFRLALDEHRRFHPSPTGRVIFSLRRCEDGRPELAPWSPGDRGPRLHCEPMDRDGHLKCFYEIGGEMVPFMIY